MIRRLTNRAFCRQVTTSSGNRSDSVAWHASALPSHTSGVGASEAVVDGIVNFVLRSAICERLGLPVDSTELRSKYEADLLKCKHCHDSRHQLGRCYRIGGVTAQAPKRCPAKLEPVCIDLLTPNKRSRVRCMVHNIGSRREAGSGGCTIDCTHQ